MKQYRVLSRDAEFSKAWPKIDTWHDWEEIWSNKEEPQNAIDRNKDADVFDNIDPETTKYKIQEREVTEWRDCGV